MNYSALQLAEELLEREPPHPLLPLPSPAQVVRLKQTSVINRLNFLRAG